MKRILLSLVLGFYILSLSSAQVVLYDEDFGSLSWNGNPADFPYYSSDALFSGDDSHAFSSGNSSGYTAASGATAILMGNWNTAANTDFVIQYDTEGYINIRLSFGMRHNSSGWGTCQLTNNYTNIEYSTDSANWSPVDKAQLLDGSSWPCADDGLWAFIELAQVLPSHPTLYIRFTHTSPAVHPYLLDDIRLSGYMPDNDPPTIPSNLSALNTDFSSFLLAWNASEDAGGINHYKIYKDGKYLLSTSDTLEQIKYQQPGSSAGFSVIAFDIAGNPSPESPVLPVIFDAKPAGHTYSWETQHAKVLPTGEMEWQPETFSYVEGPSVRYIDYENGDDSNDGLSKSSAWKHHPWDKNATSVAAGTSGIHTYVFKRGVVYRGQLIADESGTALEPIRLTSDPAWGEGDARFFGSSRLEGTWTRANAASAPDIPDPEKVWYMNVTLPNTKMVCELKGDALSELRVARSPNYRYTPDDPLKTWYTWTGKTAADGGLWLRDFRNLTQTDPDYYKGATVFSQEDAIVMCTVWKQDVQEWDPTNKRIKVASTSFGGAGCHYFIENTPFLLDTTSEFYYDSNAKRLFLRLDGDRDPNTTIIEAAVESEQIRIDNKHHIEISGLSFAVTTAHTVRYGQGDAISSIRITGICNNINIKNNRFEYVAGGVSVNSIGSAEVNTHSISVADNDFQNIGDLAIVFATNTVYLDDITILRNNIYNNGYRHQGRSYSSIPAIYGQLNYGEVAGNIVDVSWGNGIDIFWGKGSGSTQHVPFIRGLIHHNSASNTLIGTNDYGGIESWQGGPAFCYNNFSHNASGYKHYNSTSIGYAYYFDGSFKHIVFNNIASGVSHNRNSAAIMQVLGYYNMYVHNTAYKTDRFFNAWKDALAVCGHNTYLANLGQDIKYFFKQEIGPENIPFDAYGYNVASGISFNAGLENLNDNLSLGEFQSTLKGYQSQLAQTGFNAAENSLPNAAVHDFRMVNNSTAKEKGVKFFTAFPLAQVVGEWNFYIHPADLSISMGDNFYMTEDFSNRETYKDISKNHLSLHNVDTSDFVVGALEDWTKGALRFDGETYASLNHAASSAVKSNNVDMTDNDFILEAFLKTDLGHTGGVIVSKYGGSEGYELKINNAGQLEMSLYTSGAAALSRQSSEVVNDSLWHHVLVEVNRYATIDIYLDGELANGASSGAMPEKEISLSSPSDLLVGKDQDNNFYHGVIDFLRISKASLYDARTTADEIYSWETNGPFLYDIKGGEPDGKRDAGAIEAKNDCEFYLTEDELAFESDSATIILTAYASDGLVLRESENSFFSVNQVRDTFLVHATANPSIVSRSGSFSMLGCGQSHEITISQAAGPCNFTFDTDTIHLTYNAQNIKLPFTSNADVTASYIPGTFFTEVDILDADTLFISVPENLTIDERTGNVKLQACDLIHELLVIQDGGPCTYSIESDSFNLSHLQQDFVVRVSTNSYFSVGIIPEGFIGISLGPVADSVVLNIQENKSPEPRTTQLPVEVCGNIHMIKISQEGLVGLTNYSMTGELAIYPNPINGGSFKLKLPFETSACQYFISDLSGKKIQNGTLFSSEETITINSEAGIYLLSVIDNERIYKSRIVLL